MATYQADQVRAVAIELRNKIASLYIAALPIFRATAQWTLNGVDPDVPAPFAVKVMLESYKALKVDSLKLEWGTALLQASPDDTLTYPPPPSGGLVIFDSMLQFTEKLIF
jgi:hypothetical protein